MMLSKAKILYILGFFYLCSFDLYASDPQEELERTRSHLQSTQKRLEIYPNNPSLLNQQTREEALILELEHQIIQSKKGSVGEDTNILVTEVPTDLHPCILRFCDNETLLNTNIVSTQWKLLSEDLVFKRNKNQILFLFNELPRLQKKLETFFTNFKDKNESKMFLFVLNKFLTDHYDFFLSTNQQTSVIDKRLNYTLGMIIRSSFKEGYDFILDNADAYNTHKNKYELMIFLSDLLPLVRNVDRIWLNSTYYTPLYEMDEKLAEILGEGVGNSCLEEIRLRYVNFFRVPDSLHIFLNKVSQNKSLISVDLGLEGYRYDVNVVEKLIQNVSRDISFKLILPFNLDFENPQNNTYMKNLLNNHFGDNIQFYNENNI